MDRNDQFVTKHPTIGSETLMNMGRLRGVRVKLFALLTSSPLDDPGKKKIVAPPEVPRLLYIIL